MSPNPNADVDSVGLLETKSSVLSFAEALFLAGNEHRYQKKLVLLLSIQRISLGFLFTVFPFLFKQPKFQCKSSIGTDYFLCDPTPDNCKLDIMPVPGSDNSLITYFGLYCELESYASLAKTMFTAACSIGTLVLFPMADKMGRRPGLIGSYILGAISLFLLAHTSNWLLFVILLGLAGFGLSPYLTNSFLLFNESAGIKMRANASVIVNWFWTIGQIVASILAYAFDNDWKSLVLYGIAIPLLTTAPLVVIWARESPMFLASRKKFEEAKDVLGSIARINNRELPAFEFTEEKSERRKKSGAEENKKSYNYLDLFRFRSLRMSTLLGAFLCFAIYFNYFGTIFALASVQVTPYVLTVLLAISELVAYYVSGVMAQKLPRRLSFAICSSVCCGANLLFIFFPVPENSMHTNETPYQVYMQLILSMTNRFSVSIAMALIGIYINEIFPTSVRALGSGLIVFVGRLGSFGATLAISLCIKVGGNPIMMFGAICIPAIFVSFMAKETFGLPLPEAIEEEKPDYIETTEYKRKKFKVGKLYKLLGRYVGLEIKKKVKNVKDDFSGLEMTRDQTLAEPEHDA